MGTPTAGPRPGCIHGLWPRSFSPSRRWTFGMAPRIEIRQWKASINQRNVLKLFKHCLLFARGVLFYNAPDHVTENIKAYTTDELCMVAWYRKLTK